MSLLNFAAQHKTEDGAKFPASAYAYVPDPGKPSTWKIRLWETPTAKETAGQVGRAAAAFSAGGFRGNPAEIPAKDVAGVKAKVRAAWKRQNPGKSADDMPDSIKMSACFSVRDEEAGVVHRWGKLFEAGDYKAHKFAMTPEEVLAAAADFRPCDLNLQHGPSILDGKLGRLEEVEASEDGSLLFGRVGVPIWLDDAVGERPFTVSTEWDRATKRLDGLAIEIDPQVEDAVLFAAKKAEGRDPDAEDEAQFAEILKLPMPGLDQGIVEQCIVAFKARHDTYSGQSAIQDIHDTAARYGAVCPDPDAKANMQSQHESTALQAVHDMMAEHGAKHASKAASSPPWMFKAEPIVHGEEATPANEHAEKETGVMSKLMDDIKAMLTKAGVDPDKEIVVEPPVQPDAKPTPDPAVVSAENREFVQMRAERDRLLAERQVEQATVFADGLIKGQRILPVAKEAVIALHMQAADDDRVSGKVMLATGKEGTRVDKLAAFFAVLPEHGLVDERLPGLVHAALVQMHTTDASKPGEGEDADTIKALAEKTTLGKAAFAAKN